MSEVTVLDTDLSEELAAIRQRLITARKAAGLSQGQVARLLGYTNPVLSFLEAGRSELTLTHFLRLCHVYGISPVWALTGINPDFDPTELIEQMERKAIPKEEQDQVLDLLAMLR